MARADPCSFENGGCDSLASCVRDASAPNGRRCGACPAGYDGDGFTCVDTNECAVANGGCDQLTQCINTPGGRTCGMCPSGYEGTGEAGCQDVDECAEANGGCDPLTECANLEGKPRECGPCPNGYVGSGYTICKPAVATCSATANGGCDPLTTCEDSDAGPTCGPCPVGYAGTGLAGCLEIDACESRPCFAGVDCTDAPAPDPGTGYTCGDCPGGTYGDGVDCFADACFEMNGGCSPMVECTNDPSTPEGRQCGPCPSGYESPDGVTCVDVDGCSSSPCFEGVVCRDVAAPQEGYACGPCPIGYSGDGVTCIDIDECAESNGGCDPRTACENMPGSRTCGPCPPGFHGSGDVGCVPTTTCEDANGGCDLLTACTDTPDGSTCGPCPSGYEGDGATGCKDIDGCAESPCFPGAVCSDEPAPGEGYTCGPCPEGYAGNADVKVGTCSLCSTSAAIAAISVARGRLLRTQDLRIVANAGALADGCTNTEGFDFRWSALISDKAAGATKEFDLTDDVNFRTTKTLFVPRGTLPADTKAVFAFTASLRGEPRVSASVTSEVFVSRADLVARIAGGGVSTGDATPLALDAALSNDPDSAPGDMSFAWTCTSSAKPDGLCYDASDARLVLPRVSTLPPITLLGGIQGNPVRYRFTIAVSKGERQASASTAVDVEKGKPPSVSIAPLEAIKPNPSISLKLIGAAESTFGSGQPIMLAWSLFDLSQREWVDLAKPGVVASTSLATQYLAFKAGALASGRQYGARLSGTDDTGTGVAWLNFTTNSRPIGGRLTLELPSDTSAITVLATNVKLICSDFQDEDEPLLYLFAVTKADGTEITLRCVLNLHSLAFWPPVLH